MKKITGGMSVKKIIAFALVVVMLFALAVQVLALPPIYQQTDVGREITLDGVVTVAEWGEPVGSWTKNDCWNNNATYGWDFWQNTEPPAGQKVELYMDKDDTNLYLAVRLVNAYGLDTTCPNSAGLWNAAHMCFVAAPYVKGTTVPVVDFAGNRYEQYNGYIMGLQNGTTKVNRSFSQGMTATPLTDGQYEIKYDATTKTYTYEVVLPLSATTIRSDTEMVSVSIEVGDSKTPGKNANRYHISKAAQKCCDTSDETNKTLFGESHPLIVELLSTYVKDEAAPMSDGITLDGSITTEEWGEPVIVTTPKDCARNWGNFWEFDPAAVEYGQKAKVYLTNDEDYIYVGFTMDKCTLDTTCTGTSNLWKAANFSFTMAPYNAATTVPRTIFEGNTYEQWAKFSFGLKNGTTQICAIDSLGLGVRPTMSDSDYKVSYDATKKTYTYEVRIAYGKVYVPLYKNQAIAMSIDACAPYTTGAGANRYNITTGSANATHSANTYPHAGNALKFTLNDPTENENCYVRDVATPIPDTLNIDGVISEAEWGEPVVVSTPKYCRDTWGAFWDSDPTAVTLGQKAKLYVTNDADYIYIGATLDSSDLDTTCASAADLWKSAALSFSLSAYDATTTVPRITYMGNYYEQYVKYTIGLVGGTQQANTNQTMGIDKRTLTDDNYSVKYDAITRTYTYEVRIPYSFTNISILDSRDVAISINMGCTNVNGGENNRYNLTSGAGMATTAPNMYPHQDKALKFTLNDPSAPSAGDCYVRDHATAVSDAPEIDGRITESEWGEPVVVSTPQFCRDTWSAFWNTDKTAVVPYQKAKLYLTNDTSYIYIGATLDSSDLDTTCASAADLWKSASLTFSLSAYDATTTVPRITYMGDSYEQYVEYMVGLVGGTQQASVNRTLGIDPRALTDDNFSVKYDAPTRTYTYEIRIPYSFTNISILDSRDVAISVNMGCTNVNGGENNRYNLTTGAAMATNAPNAYPHQGKALKFTLNDPSASGIGDCYVRDHATTVSDAPELDGRITESEWGEPVVVSTPQFCRDTWGAFWNTDKAAVVPDQKAKLYLTNDSTYIYIGATLDKCDLDTSAATAFDLWHSASLTVTLSEYDAENGVKRTEYQGDTYEQYVRYVLGLVGGSTETITSGTLGIDPYTPSGNDYKVSYSASTRTYTYELRVPISKTNIPQIDGRDIAVSVNIGCPNVSGGENNRYNFTAGAAQASPAPNNFPHKNQVMKMTLNEVSHENYDQCYVRTEASSVPTALSIDGEITESEWGEPIVVTTPQYCRDTWGAFWSIDRQDVVPGQLAKLYYTNDEDYIYVGLTLDKCDLDTTCTNKLDLWKSASFSVSVGQFDEDTTVQHTLYQGSEYERYVKYVVGLVDGTTKSSECKTLGIDAYELADDDYNIKYDPATRTYTYELRISYANTNIDPFTDLSTALSVNIGCPNVRGWENNRYNLTTGAAFAVPGPGVFPHDGQAMKVTLNDISRHLDTYVSDTVQTSPGKLRMDGVITAAEWGKPVIVTSPRHCQATWGNFWQFDKGAVEQNQAAMIYVTNDDDYIYFGATLDESDFDDGCTKAGDLWKYAHFIVTFSVYDKDTTYPHVRSMQKNYEQFSRYALGFVNGEPAIANQSQKISHFPIEPDDWAVKYDAATRTYTYELRVPYENTTLRRYNNDMMAMSVSLGCAYTGKEAANRYNITTGAALGGGDENWAHKNNAIVLHMNRNPYTVAESIMPVAVTAVCSAVAACFCIVRRRRIAGKTIE